MISLQHKFTITKFTLEGNKRLGGLLKNNLITTKKEENRLTLTIKSNKKYFKIIRKKKFNLSSSKVILIRQDPPFNIDYINSTLLLDSIKNRTKIINNPESVRNISEKLFSIKFMQLMPPTIFTKNLNK